MSGRQHKPPAARAIRVAEQVQHELAELIRSQVKDPGLGMVTVTGIDLTADYAYATVHYTVLPDDEASLARTDAALKRAAHFLRMQLGERVRIHTTPQLRFALDRSIEQGIRMSRLIDRANATRAKED